MITVACVLVNGNVPFTPEYVSKLHSMVMRTLPRPFRMICLTDQPAKMPSLPRFQVIKVPETPTVYKIPGWWSKLELFNERHLISGPTLYLDLDVILVASLAPIVDFDADVAMIPHAGTFEGRDGKKVFKRFNSSVMWFRQIEHYRFLYNDWMPEVAHKWWGDQDWIGKRMPNSDKIQTMPLGWFPRISEIPRRSTVPMIPEEAKVILCKKPKNHEAAKQFQWVASRWR